jgi:serine/threonine protein kinase
MDRIEFLAGDRALFENFKITTFIARGNAMVYEVEDGHGAVECVKELRLSSRNDEAVFEREVKLLSEIRGHPHGHIIGFRGWYITRDCRNSLNIFKNGYIQMERALTSLEHLIHSRLAKPEPEHFRADEVSQFMREMLSAHLHLQRLSLAHRDIKPDNILLTSLAPLRFKICDVGVGTEIDGESTKTHTLIGTVSYLSP